MRKSSFIPCTSDFCLVYLAVTETQKRKPNKVHSSSRKVTSSSSTTVSVKTKERTEPNPPMPAEVAERLKIKEGNTEAGGQETLPSSTKEQASMPENTQPSQSLKQESSSKVNQVIRKLLPISLKLQEEWYFCAPATVHMCWLVEGLAFLNTNWLRKWGLIIPMGRIIEMPFAS